jgi:Bacterial antitoxin of type II TA system, VapB
MKRTTILVDDALLIEARSLAQQRAMTFTALVNEALRAYVQTQRTPRHLSCIGVGRSERPTRSLRDGGDEAALRAGINRVEGWSPHRAVAGRDEREAGLDEDGSLTVVEQSETSGHEN